MAWAFMLMATVAALASCSSDNDDNDTLPAEAKAEMYGKYSNLAVYGSNLTTSAISVTVTADKVTFNIPVKEILPSVMSADNGLEEAQETVKADNVEESYTFVRYYNSIATFSIPTQTVNFTYTVGGVKKSGSVKITTPSFGYNTSTKKLNFSFAVDAVTINGKAVDGYKKRVMRMNETQKNS